MARPRLDRTTKRALLKTTVGPRTLARLDYLKGEQSRGKAIDALVRMALENTTLYDVHLEMVTQITGGMGE